MHKQASFLKEKVKKSSRSKKPVAHIFVEGGKKNKTERLYFSAIFRLLDCKYTLKFHSGDYTDLQSMINLAKPILKSSDFKENEEDKIFCVVDIDGMVSKAKYLQALYEKYHSERLIIIFSNPTIELWYKLHFTYSTRPYHNGQEVIADLKSYIPQYNKNVDCFSYLESKTWDVVKNSEKLLKSYSKTAQPYLIVLNHTGTMMHEMINEILIKKQKK